MKVRYSTEFCWSKLSRSVSLSAALVLFSGLSAAQDGASLEDLEKQLAEQKIALEEAIANREATAAKAQEVLSERNESEDRKQQIEEELMTLCEEQESLQQGSFDKCMSNADS